MLLILIMLFTVVPIAELYLLIKVGGIIGTLETVFIVFVTGVVGAAMARSQGRQIWLNLQREMAEGKVPTNNLIGGMLVFGGGLLLLTPGFITDILGLSFVFPLTRWVWIRALKAHFARQISTGKVQFYSNVNMGGFEVRRGPDFDDLNYDSPREVKEINPEDK